MPLDEVTVDSCKFIVWMTISNIDDYRYANPMMPAISIIAELAFDYLDIVFETVPINEEMLDDIYGDQTFDDFFMSRQILVWIANDSYLSDWDVTRDTLDAHRQRLASTFGDITEDAQIYGARAMSAFGSKVGPLALFPQQWYAIMLRTYGEKNCKRKACTIDAIKHSPFDVYYIEKETEKFTHLIGIDGTRYAVDNGSKGISFGERPSEFNLFFGMLVCYDGTWLINGMTSLSSTSENFEDVIKEHREHEEAHERAIDHSERYVAAHEGRRLYYFDNITAMAQWMKDELKFGNVDDLVKHLPDYMKQGKHIIVFLPTDGDTEFAAYHAESINDPNNPYYDEELCHEEGMELIDDVNCFRSECIHYMIDHGMLSEVSFGDDDEERGHELYQQNLDFIVRFMRRAGY